MNNRRSRALSLFAIIFSCSVMAFAQEAAGTVTKTQGQIVDLGLWQIIWALVNFGLLYYLLKKYLSGPILDVLEARSEKIKNNLDSAEAKQNEADTVLEEYRTKMRDARKESMEIIDKAKLRAGQQEKELLEKAKADAEVMLADTKKEIQAEIEKARKELAQEVGAIGVKIASRLIEKELDEKSNSAIISDEIKKIGEAK